MEPGSGLVPAVDEGHLALPWDRRSASVARLLLSQLARDRTAEDASVHDVAIATHELVANAVDHGRPDAAGRLAVSWALEETSLRLAVRDAGTSGVVAAQKPPFSGMRGRGLHMVDAVSSGWGVQRDAEGTTVWARVPLGPAVPPTAADLFAGAGSLRELYERTDWAATGFGPVERWSPTLRATLRLLLHTRFACALFWGEERSMLYNEACVAMIGAKHPSAIGRRAQDVFAEAWPVIGPLMDHVADRLEPTWTEAEWVPLDRNGYLEDTWFTFSYSPVPNARGEVEGILDIAAEVTAEVVARQRLDVLVRLRTALEATSPTGSSLEEVRADVLRCATDVLHAFPRELSGLELHPWATGSLPPGDGVVRLDLPTTRTATAPAVLVTTPGPHQRDDPGHLAFVRLVGGAVREALERAENRAAERTAALSDRRFSRALQRSMLGAPASVADVGLAARYAPATVVDAIGGDWHDSFRDRHGDLVLVVGDVSGHDRVAALTMGQARNLLRGTVMALDAPVGRVLRVFDQTLSALDVGTLTAVLARLHHDPASGTWELSWATGGHPPPVLVSPDGTASLLQGGHGPMLGLELADERPDARRSLLPGSTVVLYTDGLVERTAEHLDTSLQLLLDVAARHASLGCEELADRLLEHAGEHRDDVALLVVRV